MESEGNARDLLPEGDSLRKAVHWLSSRHEQEQTASRSLLIEEAALRFDLSPTEVEFLQRNWEESP